MAEYWVDSNAPDGGDGLTIGNPLNAIPGNTFGNLHTWNLKYGSVFPMGASALISSHNALVRAYGNPADGDPLITGTNATLFNCSTANGTVVFEDITFMRSGAQSGAGINCQQMTAGASSFTLRRCSVLGFFEGVRANRTLKLTVENCDILSGVNSFGIRGQAFEGIDCNGWRIAGNTFDCGTDIELYVSDSAGSLGSFNNLVIENNSMQWSGATPGGTSLLLRGYCNAIDWGPSASVTIDTPGAGVHTLTRTTGQAWPNWPVGTVIFLAGFTNVANFGTVTVTSGGNTTAVTVTNLGATLANEAASAGKGAGIRDPLRAFNDPIVRNNKIGNRGYTPFFLDNFVGGIIEGNEFTDTVAVGQVSAAIEAFNCIGTIARHNIIRGMTGHVLSDSQGIFWDGACENCVAHGNYISGIRPTSDSIYDTYGTALAAFHCKNCVFHSNIVVNCRRGCGANAVSTTASFYNNTISDCNRGFGGSNALTDGAITFKNNVIQRCTTGIIDEGDSVVSNNAWWQNTVDNHFGTLAAKDASAITADPKLSASFHPMPGSSLINAGVHLGYATDKDRRQRNNPPTVGAYEGPVVRTVATARDTASQRDERT